MLPSPSLGEEGAEAVVDSAGALVGGDDAVGLDAVLQAVELPASVAHLAAGLADVNRNAFPHLADWYLVNW
jgi:hypothetical protein